MSLYLLSVALLALHGQNDGTTEPRLIRTPAIYGDTIVFSYAGDLWVTKTTGQALARRLTSSPGTEIRPKISPDGKWVAFTGQYDGAPNIYVMPIQGGEPKRLTYDSAEADNCLGWTPEGKIAYATNAGNFINRQQGLWYVDPHGGMPVRSKINEISELSYFPDGHSIAYTRTNSYGFNWRHYRGGTQGRISIYDFVTNKYSELPSKREQSFFPMVVGHDIFYISDKGTGTLNLFEYDNERKSDRQITHNTDSDIKYPSTDGKKIVFERDGYLNVYDIATGTIERPYVRIASEDLAARPYSRSVANQITGLAISPSGARLALEARGEIFSVPTRSGDTRNMTNSSAARERYPQWSPDGKSIAYVSDVTGQNEVYTRPQLGGPATQLTKNSPFSISNIEYLPDGKNICVHTVDNELLLLDVASQHIKSIVKSRYGIASNDFSPDSKWMAYTEQGSNRFNSLYLMDLTTGKATKVTSGYYNDSNVSFDMNGKYLYLVSARTFGPTPGSYELSLKVENPEKIYVLPLEKTTPNPMIPPDDEEPVTEGATGAHPRGPMGPAPAGEPHVKIDLDGLSTRLVELPMPNSSYGFLLGANNGVFYPQNGMIMKFDLGSRESVPILSGVTGALVFNQSRTKIAYQGPAGVGVVDARPGNAPGAGHVDTGGLTATIDPRAEWNQIFWESWRYERDNYYDPNFKGMDWNAIGRHYHGMLQYVNSRSDLNYVLGMMIAELGTSHSYVQGGDPGAMAVRPVPTGHLGADYELVGNHVRFARIYKGESYDNSKKGPLGDPGVVVNVGDFLLEINGQTVDAHNSPDSLLVDKVGRGVTITVNSTPNLAGARQIRVVPIASEGSLRYTEFVNDNYRKVQDMSGGRIGYMHIEDTGPNGTVDFIRGFYPQVDKDALIVDERWNGGGYIQPWFVDTLARKVKAYIQSRHGADAPEEYAMEGPKALLINGYAGSGGDFFPWMFRQAKLGPLIGKRTWGGLVGINGFYNLIDGGTITCPEFSIYDPATNEIIAENHGIDPDIDVDNRPDLVADGHDPQLEEAVKYLMDKLKNAPAKKERTRLPAVDKLGHINP